MKTEAEIRAHLLEKAGSDDAFRARLISDPRGTVESEFGVTVPERFTLTVHEETPTGVHLVLPPPDGALRAEELQAIAGGYHRLGEGDTDWGV